MQEVVTALRAYRSRRGLPPRTPLVMDAAAAPGGRRALDAGRRPRRTRSRPRARHGPPRRRPLDRGRARPQERIDPEVERAPPGGRAREGREPSSTAPRRKLADARFVERAPAHLVDAEREKAARYAAERDALAARIAALGPEP